jgi:hypothetical protein
MSKVFVEYQILPQHRSAYSHWIKNVMGIHPELELLEGTDQPGLFVELWSGLSREAYEQMKEKRTHYQEQSLVECNNTEQLNRAQYMPCLHWRDMDNWVQGGVDKIHIWYFRIVR